VTSVTNRCRAVSRARLARIKTHMKGRPPLVELETVRERIRMLLPCAIWRGGVLPG